MKSSELLQINNFLNTHSTAQSRWARLGPYYAMFPMKFAYDTIACYSKKGDYVLDPFAGRGSSLFAGASLGRVTHGIEINPVGWVFSRVKLAPASKEAVFQRLNEIYQLRENYIEKAYSLPEFFSYCFSRDVLLFLLAVKELDWKNNIIDTTVIAIILHYLHGKREQSLSNQMSMVKSMSPQYSIDWWIKKNLREPPNIDVMTFLTARIDWRYSKGLPVYSDSKIILGDSTTELNKILANMQEKNKRYSLLFTSPPYCGVTNYFTDQWLRLWLLGGPSSPKTDIDKHKKRFISTEDYKNLLDNVFKQCKMNMADKATVFVRTDSREFTFDTTKTILGKYFDDFKMKINRNECSTISQTELYANSTEKPCEMDIILVRK